MHMVHLVHSSDRISCVEACAALHTNARQFSCTVIYRNEARVFKHLPVFVATNVNVNVRDCADAHAFVDRVEAPVRHRSSYLLRTYGSHRLTVTTKHVETAVKMMTTIVRVETATHFTHRRSNFMRTLLRIEGP